MPSRVRVILRYKLGAIYTGKRAIVQMWQAVINPALRTRIKKLPSRMIRLTALMAEMPPEWTLTLVREPRGTRKLKSLYWRLQNEPGDKQELGGGVRAPRQQAVGAQELRAARWAQQAAQVPVRRRPVPVVRDEVWDPVEE